MKPDATPDWSMSTSPKERDHQRVDFSGRRTTATSLSFDSSNFNLPAGDRWRAECEIGTREQSGGVDYSGLIYGQVPLSFDLSGFFERLEFVNASNKLCKAGNLLCERTGGGSIGAFLHSTNPATP